MLSHAVAALSVSFAVYSSVNAAPVASSEDLARRDQGWFHKMMMDAGNNPPSSASGWSGTGTGQSAPGYNGHHSSSASAPAPTGSQNAGGFAFPLQNGFPSPSADALTAIEIAAQGTLPNGPPPPSLAEDDLTSLQLIAFNEISEVAFFTELIANVTNKVPGYEVPDDNGLLLKTLIAVQAQEELHALNANGALAHFGKAAITPCRYNFPVATLKDALALAQTFTDVVLGTLANVQLHLAQNGDAGLVPAIGSVIGQEGEQNGFYRATQGLIPSSLPFLTASSRGFAFSALNQLFVVPGSCDAVVKSINLPIFAPLSITSGPVTAKTQTLSFAAGASSAVDYSKAQALVYINQQNVPVVVDITQTGSGSGLSFTANFPYDQFLMNGLTIAAVVNSKGPFSSADAVAAATIAGPGLIEIN